MAGVIRIHKPQFLLFLTGVILLLLAVKQMPGFVTAGPPLPLDNRPALLFFNSEEGCECVLDFYALADTVVDGWAADARGNIPIHRILVEERPDLERRYKVDRPPELLLLDGRGEVVWRDRGVASNPQVFELGTCVEAIQTLALVPAP
jgi:hypothetical protein